MRSAEREDTAAPNAAKLVFHNGNNPVKDAVPP